jgi:hypothetical protein
MCTNPIPSLGRLHQTHGIQWVIRLSLAERSRLETWVDGGDLESPGGHSGEEGDLPDAQSIRHLPYFFDA